jgi:hypothetical protein
VNYCWDWLPEDKYLLIVCCRISLWWVHKSWCGPYSCSLCVWFRCISPPTNIASCNPKRYYLSECEVERSRFPESRHRNYTSQIEYYLRIGAIAYRDPFTIRFLRLYWVLVNFIWIIVGRLPVYSYTSSRSINRCCWDLYFIRGCACLNANNTWELSVSPIIFSSYPNLISYSSINCSSCLITQSEIVTWVSC